MCRIQDAKMALGLAVLLVVTSVGAAKAADGEQAPYDAPSSRSAAATEAPPSSAPSASATAAVLGGPQFYLAVGRPDLVDAYERRRTAKTFVRVIGAVPLGVGVLWFLINSVEAGAQNPPARVDALGPVITMLAGGAIMVAPSAWSDDPVSYEERVELARAAFGGKKPQGPLGLNVTAAPTVRGVGGTLVLSARF